MSTYIFKCEDFDVVGWKYGYELAEDKEGLDIVHVEWFLSEEERDDAIIHLYETEENIK